MIRRPFISVYSEADACRVGGGSPYLTSYSPAHREQKEQNLHDWNGCRPLYRINLKLREIAA